MRETIELRVDEEQARGFFAPGEGRMLGDDLRVLKLDGDDPRLPEIARRDQESGGRFFGFWNITRKYTRAEIAAADAFLFRIKGAFEPAAEDSTARSTTIATRAHFAARRDGRPAT